MLHKNKRLSFYLMLRIPKVKKFQELCTKFLILCKLSKKSICTGCPKKSLLRIFRTYWIVFSKTVLNKKTSSISTSNKNKISIISHMPKSYRPVNICKTAFSRQGFVKKKHSFRNKIRTIWSIMLYFLSWKLETVLRISKKKKF